MHVPKRPPEIHILVACMPKSGSTLLSEALASLPGMRRASLVPGHQRREQEICLKRIEDEIRKTDLLHQIWFQNKELLPRPRGFVAQMHLRHSSPSQEIFDAYNVVPVVLVRNIFDVVVSLRDHFEQIAPTIPMAYVSEEMRTWPEERMYQFIAELVVPWYINFFTCWSYSPAAVRVTYENLVEDLPGTVNRVAISCGLRTGGLKSVEDIVSGIEGDKTRQNKGVVGRGSVLPDEIRYKIRQYAKFYPNVDFSPIGLPRPKKFWRKAKS